MVSWSVLIMLVAAAGLVGSNCPDLSWRNHGRPYLTVDAFSSDSLASASAYCENCGMQLCTLNQMLEAYINGFRSQTWALFDKLGYDTRSSECSSRYVSDNECYAMYNSPNEPASGVIPRTPRPYASSHAWCCGK